MLAPIVQLDLILLPIDITQDRPLPHLALRLRKIRLRPLQVRGPLGRLVAMLRHFLICLVTQIFVLSARIAQRLQFLGLVELGQQVTF